MNLKFTKLEDDLQYLKTVAADSVSNNHLKVYLNEKVSHDSLDKSLQPHFERLQSLSTLQIESVKTELQDSFYNPIRAMDSKIVQIKKETDVEAFKVMVNKKADFNWCERTNKDSNKLLMKNTSEIS